MSDIDFGTLAQFGASHPNPTFDFLTGFAPRKLKDLFRWVEYLYYNSPQIFAALKKFAEYPVTEVTIDSDNAELKKNWDKVLTKDIAVKGNAIRTGLDVQLYGNSFISIYRPFDRMLVCGHEECKQLTGIRHVKYKFTLKDMSFAYTCKACNRSTKGTIEDKRVTTHSRINIIRWDPKLMDINYNPMTGESRYYYTIPGDVKAKVKENDEHLINTMPREFLEAIRDDQVFEFAEGEIYHMKIDPPAGIESQWGFPPLTSTIKLFFYTAILRKANEAIALEHILPFRVLHPAPISGNVDPVANLNLANWVQEMRKNIKQWRRDPLHIMFAPTALGVTMMGGQGRSLLTLGEVKDAEDNIIAAMGIPKEFLYGGLSFTGSAITLRMLENQLETYAKQQNDQLQWIIDKVASILKWKTVDAEFIPFRMIDDSEQKAAIMQLHQLTGGALSKDTLFSAYEIDLAKEREKRMQESLDDARFQLDLQKETTKMQQDVAQQAQAEAGGAAGLTYNPQAVQAAADQFISSMQQLDPGSQRSQLDHLSQEDAVMYAVVKDRMQTQQTMQNQQAVANMRQQQQPPM